MGLLDVFVFNDEAYQRKISSSSYSNRCLESNIHEKRRQCYGDASTNPSSFGLTSFIAKRNLSVAQTKLHILEKEWRRRGHSKLKWTDRIMPYGMGAVASYMDSSKSRRDLRRSRSGTLETSARRKVIYESSDGRQHLLYSPKSSRRSNSHSGGRSSSRSGHHRESSGHRTHYVDVHRDHHQRSLPRRSSSRAALVDDSERFRASRPRASSFSHHDRRQYHPSNHDSIAFRNSPPPAHRPVHYPENRHEFPRAENAAFEPRINGGGAPFGFDGGQQQRSGPLRPQPLPSPNNFVQQTNQSPPYNNMAGYFQQ